MLAAGLGKDKQGAGRSLRRFLSGTSVPGITSPGGTKWPYESAVARNRARAPAVAPRCAMAKFGDFVFVNRKRGPLSRDSIAYELCKYVAEPEAPTLHRHKVPLHLLRHGCAVAILQAGIDITVTGDYLGHASIATTNHYLSSTLQMKGPRSKRSGTAR